MPHTINQRHVWAVAKALLWCCGFVCLLLAAAVAVQAHDVHQGQAHRVLVLNSYHKGFEWTDRTVAGLEDTLAGMPAPVELMYEYFDTKRHSPNVVLPSIFALLKQKYHQRVDVVVATDNNALRFILQYRNQLFPNVPVVFSGVSSFDDPAVSGLQGMTGVMENSDVAGTVRLMRQLHPQLKTLVLLGDNSADAVYRTAAARQALKEQGLDVGLTVQSWLGKREGPLENNATTAVLLLTSAEFSNVTEEDNFATLVRRVLQHNNLPVYSLWDYNIKDGVVGGLVASGYSQGQQAGRLVRQILQGVPAEKLPVVRSGLNTPMFDYTRLSQLGLNRTLLPAGSVFVNEPQSFYYRHKKLFWIVGGVIVGQMLLLAFLATILALRRRYEKKLRENRNLLAHHLTNTPLASIVWNAQLVVTDWNRAAEQIFGFSAEEAVGKSADVVLGHNTHSLCVAQLRLCLTEGSVRSGMFIWQNRQGVDMHLEWYNTPLMDGQGNITGVASLVLDVTGRMLAEKQARLHAQRMQDFAKISSDWFWETDKNHRFITISPNSENRVTYFRQGDLIWDKRDKTSQMVTDMPFLRRTMENHEDLRNLRYEVHHPNGDVSYRLLSARPFYDEVGVFAGYRGCAVDITALVQSQLERQKLEQGFLQMIENMTDGVALWDAQEHFVMCNSAYAKLFRYPGGTIPKGISFSKHLQNCLDYGDIDLGGEDEKLWAAKRLAVLRETRNNVLEVCLRGRFYQVQQHRTLDNGMMMTVTDITQLKEAAVQQKALEKRLEQIKRTEYIAQLAASISHEFNNRLVPVLGLSQMVERQIAKENPESTLRQPLQMIQQAALQASKLVRTLLNVGRHEQTPAVQQDAVPLNRVLSETLPLLRAAFNQPVELVVDVAENLPDVPLSADDVQHILLNLCLNARDAIGRATAGVVKLSVGSVQKNGVHNLRIIVSDNGCGMDAQTVERIFEPFFSTKNPGQGSGLGLAILNTIVQKVQGQVRVESTPGKGTEITVDIPVAT